MKIWLQVTIYAHTCYIFDLHVCVAGTNDFGKNNLLKLT